MSDVSLTNTIATGQQRSAAKIQKNFEDLRDFVNGDGWIDSSKLGAGSITPAAMAGVKIFGGGKSITATEQSRTNTTYGPLNGTSGVDATDEVRGIPLPLGGLILFAFQGQWKEANIGAARAGLFLGSNQVVFAAAASRSPAEAAIGGTNADTYVSLFSALNGLASYPTSSGSPYLGDVTTGQLVGGITTGVTFLGGFGLIFADAGTYDLSVRWKASSGAVTAKARSFWAVGVAL